MSLFKDWGTALSRPFQRTVEGFKQVFTNPGKANFGDFISVALPFWGGTLVSDFNNPKDIGYQAATLAAVSGGVHAAGLTKPYALAGVDGAALPPATTIETGAARLAASEAATAKSALVNATAGIPGTTLPMSSASGPGVLAGAEKAGKAVGDFVVKAAAVSNAAQQIASPWRRAVDAVREKISGAGAQTGISVNSGGGVAPPSTDAEAPQQAGLGTLLGGGLVLGVGLYLLWDAVRSK